METEYFISATGVLHVVPYEHRATFFEKESMLARPGNLQRASDPAAKGYNFSDQWQTLDHVLLYTAEAGACPRGTRFDPGQRIQSSETTLNYRTKGMPSPLHPYDLCPSPSPPVMIPSRTSHRWPRTSPLTWPWHVPNVRFVLPQSTYSRENWSPNTVRWFCRSFTIGGVWHARLVRTGMHT